ncbi:NCS1 nucleoside transporter family protein-1 [Coleophoma cylindrospora]|uniref:NCS1 nucleoside transporter family protein-1 n=1 Tax=Coleophoma cylindrospora TaxID=1849047 RepID=A0A3D8RUN5_9HELO|nr:NCS1 nucleoside transporter family protein-1 [Coleophoma cylindrospora]
MSKEYTTYDSQPVDISTGYSHENNSLWTKLKGKATLEVSDSRMAPGLKFGNRDLDPVEPEFQTWRTHDFVMYWISDAFAVSNWRIGSSLIAIGLSWKLALVAVVIGNFMTALVVTFNGLIGARLHIPFTVQARSAYGFYFAYVMIIFRVVISIFWYGIGTYTGAECIQSMIYAIWPRFRDIPNKLPESANITTGFMICYIIYWIICLPFHYIPAHQVRWFFTFKSIVTPIAGFAIIGWIVHSTGGGNALFVQGSSVSGSRLGWTVMQGIYSMVGNFATLGVNMNDFARYSKKPNSPYVQLVVIPIVFVVMMLFGIIGANGSKIIYGELLWDPLLIVNNWTSKGGRAGAFFCAFAFLIASIGVNISADSIAVAIDLSAILPRYINIRRGQFICAILGAWAMTPWNILVSAESLINFMNGYTVWLAPMAGILIADYWIVHKQVVSVPEMYQPDGIYAYNRWGTNWRAAVAFFVGFVPLLPGFAQSVNSKLSVPQGAIDFYALGYFYGFFVGGGLHVLLSKLFPPKETMLHKHGVGVRRDDYEA